MSENGIVMRDAGVIAREINFIKEQTKRQMLAASMEIGARLCEAKELVGHGEWEKWLCENVDYSQSTANNLMRIYREYGSQQINLLTGKAPAEVFAEISYTQAVALMGLPMPERMELAAEKDVAAMSTRELEREVEARRAAETRAETLDAELAAASDEKSALEAEIEALRGEIGKIQAAAAAPAQVDMNEYIRRTDADNARITAVEAARRESADALATAKSDAEKAKTRADKLKAEMDNAAASGKAEAEKAYSEALRAAEERAAALEDKLRTSAAPVVQKFAIYFEQLQETFNRIFALLDDADEGEAAKIRVGLRRVLDAMSNAIGGDM